MKECDVCMVAIQCVLHDIVRTVAAIWRGVKIGF